MQTAFTGIILFVHDVEKLTDFYVNNLRLHLISPVSPEWVLLKAGLGELGLHKIGGGHTQTAQANSNTKMIFELNDDIFTIHKELLGKGVSVREVKTWDDYPYWLCDGEDPEGNVFQLRTKKI